MVPLLAWPCMWLTADLVDIHDAACNSQRRLLAVAGPLTARPHSAFPLPARSLAVRAPALAAEGRESPGAADPSSHL